VPVVVPVPNRLCDLSRRPGVRQATGVGIWPLGGTAGSIVRATPSRSARRLARGGGGAAHDSRHSTNRSHMPARAL